MNNQFITAKRFFNELKKTVYLYNNLWKECTTALLHAPREVDKTPTALNIASDVARSGKDVLYINAEGRLGNQNIDSDNLYIFTPEFESIDDKSDYADLVFEAIEHAVRTTAIRTFVIDSVSRIAALSFGRNASPAYIMKRLVALQVKCKLSILVVANDSTKSTNNTLLSLAAAEITIDDNDGATPDKLENITRPEPKHAIPLIPSMSRQQRRALERRSSKNSRNFSI